MQTTCNKTTLFVHNYQSANPFNLTFIHHRNQAWKLIAYAKSVGVALLGVEEKSIEWLTKSTTLRKGDLSGGWIMQGQNLTPGCTFEVSKKVRNCGKKVIRHLETYIMCSGPFTTIGKRRHKRAKLAPDDLPRSNKRERF